MRPNSRTTKRDCPLESTRDNASREVFEWIMSFWIIKFIYIYILTDDCTFYYLVQK